MGYGLASDECDIDLPFIASVSDAFYIGGTKQGALFGEALVLLNPALKEDFRYILKQNGGMLAKGRLLGIQFEELFRDDLYMELSRHADALAAELRALISRQKYPGFSGISDESALPDSPKRFLEIPFPKFHLLRPIPHRPNPHLHPPLHQLVHTEAEPRRTCCRA